MFVLCAVTTSAAAELHIQRSCSQWSPTQRTQSNILTFSRFPWWSGSSTHTHTHSLTHTHTHTRTTHTHHTPHTHTHNTHTLLTHTHTHTHTHTLTHTHTTPHHTTLSHTHSHTNTHTLTHTHTHSLSHTHTPLSHTHTPTQTHKGSVFRCRAEGARVCPKRHSDEWLIRENVQNTIEISVISLLLCRDSNAIKRRNYCFIRPRSHQRGSL